MMISARGVRPPREIVIPLRYPVGKIPPVTRVRSTLLRSSLRSLGERGFLSTYSGHLPADLREAVIHVVAGTWIEVDLALAHYRAINALQLSVSDQVALGSSVGSNVQGLLLGTMMRVARGMGITPWSGVGQYVRIWDRLFVGGDLQVEKVTEKEALVTLFGLSLLDVPYFRTAVRGLIQSGLSAIWSFRQPVVTELSCSPTTLSVRMTWL